MTNNSFLIQGSLEVKGDERVQSVARKYSLSFFRGIIGGSPVGGAGSGGAALSAQLRKKKEQKT